MIRTIVTPHNQDISIHIPESFVGKEVEVIIFTLDEGKVKLLQEKKKKVSFNATSLDTRGYKFNREEANER